MMPAALILAGSRAEVDPLAASEGVSHKALIVLEGRPLLARVHAALTEAGIGRIAVSADDPQVVALARVLGAEVIAPDKGPSGSVARAYARLGAPMLVTTSDHALLRAEWVRDFVAETPPGADVAVLMAARSTVEAALPGTRRTWLRFADGEWSGCNLFHIASASGANAIATWQQVEAERKRPWRIAARLGLGTLWSYWRGSLTLADALARLGRRIDIEATLVAAHDGLAAVDVDKAQDLADVRRITGETTA
jgi:GTP:adenosylcobinamide-phosphate guanylyltransferase